MKRLNKTELWDFCRGMDWVWSYCSTGTAESNARGVQEWVERGGDYTASLKSCRSVAAEIQRYQRDPKIEVGYGFGQSTFI